MKRSPIGPRKSPLERRRMLRRRRPWRAGVAGDDEKRTAFFAIGDQQCARRFELGQRCDGQLDPHHVIPKRAIKTYARAHRLDARSTASLLWDPSNRLVLCRRHHNLHEGAHDRVPLTYVPAGAIAFARALGLDTLIDRYYPTDEEADDAA